MDEFTLIDALHFGWRDGIEIILVAFVFYRVLRLIKGTRAIQMLVGVTMLVAIYLLAWIFKLTMLTYLLGFVFTYGVFAVLIVFQPELRNALAHLGHSPVSRLFRRIEEGQVEVEIADAVERLARSGVGAIIAIEREASLGRYIESGSALNATVSADLLTTIFTPYSPLHDGAVLVRENSIVGAGCILPLSQAVVADRSFGTRHRAALGLSEETDAVVVVVSEETSAISVAHHGVLTQGLSSLELRDLLAGRRGGDKLEPDVAMAQKGGATPVAAGADRKRVRSDSRVRV